MSDITLGIIGGGQLGSLLSVAANKLNINTVIFSDDKNSPAKNFTKNFISGNYDDEKLIKEFLSKVNVITYEFENIPYKILRKLNEIKPVLPKPEINKLIQNRYTEKDFLNKNNIRTTRYSLIKDEDDIKINEILKNILFNCHCRYCYAMRKFINQRKKREKSNIRHFTNDKHISCFKWKSISKFQNISKS